MRKHTGVQLGLLALTAIIVGCTKEVSFKKDIYPILQERCASCHTPGRPGCVASGFSVVSYQSVMKGTKYGAMVHPGSPLDSNLLRLVKHEADPSIAMPKSHTPGMPSEWLQPNQIKLIETWIDQGAKDN